MSYSSSLIRIATCNLNQWAMEFDTNLRNIRRSILDAKVAGATYRTGPELELCGYGCEDHFYEPDTEEHCWESLVSLLAGPDAATTSGILFDVGMPVSYNGARYNCRVWCYNGRIIGIRPKVMLADDGNYREPRWFTAWDRTVDRTASHQLACSGPGFDAGGSDITTLPASIAVFQLPLFAADALGQHWAPLGVFAVAARDVTLASEICEELFAPKPIHGELYSAGVDIISNASGSHHSLRKLDLRIDLMRSASARYRGTYIYANQQGCDGGRLYFDGCACVVADGAVVAQGSQFGLLDVELVLAVIDVRRQRALAQTHTSSRVVSAATATLPLLSLNARLCTAATAATTAATTAAAAPAFAAGAAPRSSGLALQILAGFASVRSRSTVLENTTSSEALLSGAGTPGVGPGAAVGEIAAAAAAAAAKSPTSSAAVAEPPSHDAAVVAAVPVGPSRALSPLLHSFTEEIALGPACWLWDYLRRSGMSGFFLPLSGGADSAATAAIVGSMCTLVANAYKLGVPEVIADLDRLFPRPAGASAPTRAEIAGHLFFTCYMGTDNSSEETRERARALAADIGASHVEGTIDSVVAASVQWVTDLTGARPTFESGSRTENLALQNVQARVRMVQAYLAAQLLLAARGRAGALLVLGSANVDEGLRGFLTKYDCSSADVNPIGGISKLDLRAFLEWGARADTLDYPSLKAIAEAKATPELIPIAAGGARQVSEEDMGFSFEELGAFGRLRKLQACGPVSMYVQLRVIWSRTPAKVIADKVKSFFRYYAINRHKMTTITPAYHAESYSPDDNRFDLRQFLYCVSWPRQFSVIDKMAAATD